MRARAAALEVTGEPVDPDRPTDAGTADPGEESSAKVAGVVAALTALAEEAEARDDLALHNAPATYEFMSRLAELSPSDLAMFLEELQTAPGLSEEVRFRFTHGGLCMLIGDHPEAALDFLTDFEDRIPMHGMEEALIALTLCQLTAEDPGAALQWIAEFEKEHPDASTSNWRKSVGGILAKVDPAEAIRLASELGIERGLGAKMGRSARNHEERTRLIEFLRAHGDDHLRCDAFHGMAWFLVDMGFDRAEPWLKQIQVAPDEAAAIVRGWDSGVTSDTGRWMDWAIEHAEEEAVMKKLRHLMGQWTPRNRQLAEDWLANLEEGRIREVMTAAYAEGITSRDPQAAAKAIASLPQGEERREAARVILYRWPGRGDDRAAFAKREGIELEQ